LFLPTFFIELCGVWLEDFFVKFNVLLDDIEKGVRLAV